jgi:hypothetical protein
MAGRRTEYAVQTFDGEILTARFSDPIEAWENYANGGYKNRQAGVVVVRFLTRADEPSVSGVLVHSDMEGSPHSSFRAVDGLIYYRSADGSRPTERISWFVLANFNPRVSADTPLDWTARYDPTLAQPTDDAATLLLRDLLRHLQDQAQRIKGVLREHDRPSDLSSASVFAHRARDILTTAADPRAELQALLDEPDPERQ